MEKRKWLWKRKSSERSPGESESSGSFSSPSERFSDEQDVVRESPQDNTQSPEVTSKAMLTDGEMKESIKCLTEKLSAALVNVSAKEDLVKQHSKVAEEAVAGWEIAENEVASLKQQLEAAVQQNLNLEVRASHLDGALKECVRQLRQSKDEQERRITEAVIEKSQDLESVKSKLEKRVSELQAEVEFVKDEKSAIVDANDLLKLEALERENSSLKQQMVSLGTEFGIMTVERDLSIQAAETASKMQLESIKKVAKLEAECRRLHIRARKSSPNQKSIANNSSVYADSLTDSHSACSDSWATALIAELDTFKNEKQPIPINLAPANSIEIDMMDDFLEMERLVSLPETKVNTPVAISESPSGEYASTENPLKAELDMMTQRVAELENKLENIEAEKLELETKLENVEVEKLELENSLENVEAEKLELEKSLENVEGEKLELENSLDENESSLKEAYERISIAESKMEELQKELIAVSEAKELLESQLIGMEVESRTMSANVDSLKVEIEKEQKLSAEREVKCQELENKLVIMVQESEQTQNTNSNSELKLKQEDLAVAADKLAECQKTIASLGLQLKSLATLEDFLIDTSNIPGLSRMSRENGIHLEN